MRYRNASEFLSDQQKSILVFGMSGVGKSFVTEKLTQSEEWQAHSIDKRIGQLLLKPILADYPNEERRLVRQRIEDGDLTPLVDFLGKPGSPRLGGRLLNDYRERLSLHAKAETFALVESPSLFDVYRSESDSLKNFVCDTGGSMCEVLDPVRDHSLLSAMSHRMLFVYIEAERNYDDVLVERFVSEPKPMYYQDKFLISKWSEFLESKKIGPKDVNPDEFAIWGFRQLVAHRRPLYEAIARRWAVTISASDVSQISGADDFLYLLANAIDNTRSRRNLRNDTLGRSFANQRRSLNLSKKRLANIVGLNEQDLNKIERDRAQVTDKLESQLYRVLFLEGLKLANQGHPVRQSHGMRIAKEALARSKQKT